MSRPKWRPPDKHQLDLEARIARRIKAFLKASHTSLQEPHFVASSNARDALKQQLASDLSEAYAIGVGHGQAMLPQQERAISWGGTRDTLARAGEIVQHIVDRVASVIATTLSKLTGGDDQQSTVDDAVNDLIDSMPDGIAQDEVTGMVEGAVFDTLQAAGIPEIRSVSEGDEKVCELCRMNEAAGAIPLGSMFPSGHACPLYHNRCRCNITTA